MDQNLEQVVALCSAVDSELSSQAEEINSQVTQIAQQALRISDLQAQIAALSVPPAPPVVFNNLELRTKWIQAGTTGNNGGGDPNAPDIGVMTPGSPGKWYAAAPVKYNNPYWYLELEKENPAINDCTKFTYELSWQFPTQADLDVCQAVEFEAQQRINGRVYNMAWQMPLKQYFVWKTFDFTNKVWENLPTPIPVDKTLIAPGKILQVVADFVRDPVKNTLTHTTISFNGTSYPVNVVRDGTVETDPKKAALKSVHAAFQLDTNGKTPTTPYIVYTTGMRFTGRK